MKFCKLFELENDEQVLVIKKYDPDSDLFVVETSTDVNGDAIVQSQRLHEESSQNEIFDMIDLAYAKKFRKRIENSLRDVRG